MKVLEKNPYTECDFGDKRLTKRAVSISERLFVKYGQPLSQIFGSASDLRDLQVINCPTVSQNFRAKPRRVVVSLYRATPTVGQFIFWIFLKEKRKAQRKKAFEEKESYRWVEAFEKISKLFNPLKRKEKELLTRIIHVFDREGDIAEVFALISNNKNTGVVVRASHNRCLEEENSHLWEYVISQEVKCIKDVELPQTKKRNARTAPLEIRFCPISIKPPYRLKNESNFRIYAVYAREINVPDDCEPVEWMLLTTESVLTQQDAITILRWYTYRWRVEEYHKILKSGCKAESYRLSGESISAMLGFLTVIAAQLLRMTYLHRTSPHLPATEVLTKTQMDVLIASSPPKLKKEITSFTIDWAIHAIARLGGYLEHRKNSAIGIQVLWRGWLELENLCQGWLLRSKLNY